MLQPEPAPEPLSRWLSAIYLRKAGFTPIFLVILSMPWVTATPMGCGGIATAPPVEQTGWQTTAGLSLVPLGLLVGLSLVAWWARRPRAVRALVLGVSLTTWSVTAFLFWLIADASGWVSIGLVCLPVILLIDLVLQLRRRRTPMKARPELGGPIAGAVLLGLFGVWWAGCWTWLPAGYCLLECCVLARATTATGHRMWFTVQMFLLSLVFYLLATVPLVPGFGLPFARIDAHHLGLSLGRVFAGLYLLAPAVELALLIRERRRPKGFGHGLGGGTP